MCSSHSKLLFTSILGLAMLVANCSAKMSNYNDKKAIFPNNIDVRLWSVRAQKYVYSYKEPRLSQLVLKANRADENRAETFTLLANEDDGSVTLLAHTYGLYVRVISLDGMLVALGKGRMGTRGERFQLEKRGKGYTLKSKYNDKYVAVDEQKYGKLRANKDYASEADVFEVYEA